jgi:hypothetical protein
MCGKYKLKYEVPGQLPLRRTFGTSSRMSGCTRYVWIQPDCDTSGAHRVDITIERCPRTQGIRNEPIEGSAWSPADKHRRWTTGTNVITIRGVGIKPAIVITATGLVRLPLNILRVKRSEIKKENRPGNRRVR